MRIYSVILFIAVGIPSLLILTASFGGVVISQKTYAQQEGQQNSIYLANNSTSNQTSSIANQSSAGVGSTESQVNQTSANQTSANQTGTAALSAKLTQSDFESLEHRSTSSIGK